MEKINIVEILKRCPKGMELDCTIFDNVTFDRVADGGIWIKHIDSQSCERPLYVYNDGSFPIHNLGSYRTKCVIFPKGKTTWEGFVPPCQFKDGDIVFYDNCVSIFKEWGDETLFRNYVKVDIGGKCPMLCDRTHSNGKGIKREARFATEEEKAKLFKSIRDNGYKWNPKTKTLENLFSYNIGKKVWVKSDKEHKYVHTIVGISRNSFGNLEYEVKEEKSGVVVHYPECLLIPITTKEPNFKVGDVVRSKNCPKAGSFVIVGVKEDGYLVNLKNHCIKFNDQDNWELVSNIEPNFKVGDTITNGKASFAIGYIDDNYYYEIAKNTAIRLPIENQDDWKLVPNKFDITTLKPFDKVLVRCSTLEKWRIQFFEKYDKTYQHPFICIGCNKYTQCIPYEGNEHLLDKTDDCKECFKTWK